MLFFKTYNLHYCFVLLSLYLIEHSPISEIEWIMLLCNCNNDNGPFS